MIALIDGDILVYECGFSSDSNAKKDNGGDHEPIEFCLKIVKNKIEEILNVTQADSYRVFLTGSDNFRLKIQPDYKANRDPSHKPFWYKDIKEYLISVHNAEVVNGMEADDAMGIIQCTSDEWTCICSKDKDMDGVPGFHYNWSPTKVERGLYFVEDLDADRFFYTQCLTGDSTDNIPGIFKSTGKKCSAKMKTELQNCQTRAEMYAYILDQYDGFDITPIAQCLWIWRKEDDLWQPPR